MKRKAIGAIGLGLFIAVAVAFGLSRQPGLTFRNALASAIQDHLHDNWNGVLDLGSVTSFDWERVCIFPPYTNEQKINERLGFIWERAASTGIESDDSICLFVFMKDGQVVLHSMFSRSDGDFSGLGEGGVCVSRAKALFGIRTQDSGRPGEPWINLFLTASNGSGQD